MLRNLNATYPGGMRRLGLCATGVLGSTIPSSGSSGPAWMYPSLQFPAASTREYAYWINAHTFPANTMPLDDTSAGTIAGLANGVYAAVVSLEEWGVYLGAFPVIVTVGGGVTHTVQGPAVMYQAPEVTTDVLTPPANTIGGVPLA